MGRLHLFEFEDQKWFPAFLRNYGTDFLQFLSNKTAMYKGIVSLLEETLHKTKTNQIVDLGSGGGGGWLWLNEEMRKHIPDLKIILTDFYPNIPAFEHTQQMASNFSYVSTPVDARDVPVELKGLRTQFLSLHHFEPEDAIKILNNAVQTKSPIAIIEGQERTIASIIAMLLSPISVLLTTPFIRPFKFGRILFTYLIPVVPLFILWDGVVSSLRTYSIEEMYTLLDDVEGAAAFEWKIGRVRSGPAYLLYCLGVPQS